jgi:hypothetical protein
MRRKLGSGENELSWAIEVMASRMAARDAGWKRRRLCSSVMIRVLLGDVGWRRAGRFDMSRLSDGLDLDDDVDVVDVDVDRERCGEEDVWLGSMAAAAASLGIDGLVDEV